MKYANSQRADNESANSPVLYEAKSASFSCAYEHVRLVFSGDGGDLVIDLPYGVAKQLGYVLSLCETVADGIKSRREYNNSVYVQPKASITISPPAPIYTQSRK